MTKMVMTIIPRDQAGRVLEGLVAAGYTATYGESRGGVLRQAQQTLFIATEEKDLEKVLQIIRNNCHTRVQLCREATRDPYSLGSVPVTTELGGAVVFIWNIERIEVY